MKVRKFVLHLLALIPVASIMFAAKQALAYDGVKAPRSGEIERSEGSVSMGGGMGGGGR